MATVFPSAVNDWGTTLASAHSAGSGTLVLASGAGAALQAALDELGLPAPSVSNPVDVRVAPATFTLRSQATIFRCTSLTGDTFDEVEAVQGTTDQAFNAGSTVDVFPTGGHMKDVAGAIGALEGDITLVRTDGDYADPDWISSLNAAKLSGTVDASRLPDFIASGAGHAKGAVPDPGASAGTAKFLREDATWQVPAGGGGGTPGGSDTQVQFNDGSVFAGAAGVTWDKTTSVFKVVGSVMFGDTADFSPGTGRVHLAGATAEFSIQNRAVSQFVSAPTVGQRFLLYVTGTAEDGSFRLYSATDLVEWPYAGGQNFGSAGPLNWSSTANPTGTKDVGLNRSAAGVLKVSDGSSGDGSIGGIFRPVSLADAAAPNNSVYFSTDASKLVYKSAAGVVSALH